MTTMVTHHPETKWSSLKIMFLFMHSTPPKHRDTGSSFVIDCWVYSAVSLENLNISIIWRQNTMAWIKTVPLVSRKEREDIQNQ